MTEKAEKSGTTEKEKTAQDKSGLPLKQEVFLEAGVHIGTKMRTHDMKQFVFKRRDDGLYILDLRKIVERLMASAKLLSRYKSEEVAVVASRVYSSNPASKFASLTGVNLIKGRFVPGTMTNMTYTGFMEPKIVLVCDPKGEREAVSESAKNGVPVIALCDTDNETKFVDLVVPINNKGKRSLALIFYILARELLMAQGKISSYEDFKYDIGYFEQQMEEKKESTPVQLESSQADAVAITSSEAPKAPESVSPPPSAQQTSAPEHKTEQPRQ